MTEIKLSQLIPNDEQVRKSWDEKGIAELSESIKNEGLIVPIKVRPTDNNHYEIVYGHRRYAAAKLAGLDDIEAIIEGVDDTDVFIQALIENISREDMNDADVSDGLIQIKKETGKTNEEIGAMFGKSESWVRHLIGISNAEKKLIRSYVRTIGEYHVREVRAGIKDEKYQLLVLEKAGEEGLPANQARIIAENVKQALEFGGEREARRELAKPCLETYEHKPKPLPEKDIRGSFSWFKDEEVSQALDVFKNFNSTIDRLKNDEKDPGTAKIILKQWEGYLKKRLDDIRKVNKEMEKKCAKVEAPQVLEIF